MNLICLLDKTAQLSVGEGALYSIVSILMVFAILLIIIGLTTLIYKMLGLFEMKKELDAKKNETVSSQSSETVAQPSTVNVSDDDMMAAILVATIDYRNECKKDVRVVSVREIK